MSEPRIITLAPRVSTDALERAALRLDIRKYPRRAEVLSIAIAERKRAEISEFQARRRAA